jgi:hypothetical protein
MRMRCSVRLYTIASLAAAVLLGLAAPARAQFVPRTVGGTVFGEDFHIEASAGFWNPTATMGISSESLGIEGDFIDFKKDLGLTDATFKEVHVVLRPARKHKLRYQFIPISYNQSATITRTIVFNGQEFVVGVPVNSGIDWKAHRFTYEYDFLSRPNWFGGFLLDVKYTDVAAFLESPLVRRERVHAAAPVPALGGIFRAYPIPNVSITGEVTGCCFGLISKLDEETTAHYVDLDIYGTYNFTNNVGAQFGYRSFDLGYVSEDDLGDFTIKGIYFGIVARY